MFRDKINLRLQKGGSIESSRPPLHIGLTSVSIIGKIMGTANKNNAKVY